MRRPTPRPLTILFLSVLAVLATSGAAHGAYTSTIDGAAKTVTLTGDGAGGFLTIGTSSTATQQVLTWFSQGNPTASPDFDTQTAGVQQVPNDGTFAVVIRAGSGIDRISSFFDVNLSALSISGGDGDDEIRGSRLADTLAGDAGNDTIDGSFGSDIVSGGPGDDRILNTILGTQSDRYDGDGGYDEVVVAAGVQDDTMTVAPDGNRIVVTRPVSGVVQGSVSAGSFERMTVNGLEGNDTITASGGLAPLIALAIEGGEGTDVLTGGDGPDTITGGDGPDAIAGAAGDDLLVGGRGDDTVGGGDGDDVAQWSVGHDSDVISGDGGSDLAAIDGSPREGDVFTVTAARTGARVTRNAAAPSVIDATIERLAIATFAGDDTVTIDGGIVALVEGGSGNDVIRGGSGHEHLVGGSGNDTIDGGAGIDLIDGDAGDDRIRSRDGIADQIRCGAGIDLIAADRRRHDTSLAECERVRRLGLPMAIDASRARLVPGARGQTLRLRLSCSAAAAGSCRGTVTLRADGRVIGRTAVTIRDGRRATVSIPIARAVRSLSATAAGRDRDGRLESATAQIELSR